MPSRRRFLQGCVTGTAGLVAGCFGGSDDGDSGGGTRPPSETQGGSTSSTPTVEGTATPDDGVLYEKSWTGVTIEKGSGWIHETPAFEEAVDFNYSVVAGESVGFDVYVFGDEHPKSEYEEWINAPSGLKFETNGIVGLSGATARDVTGSVERTPFVDSGVKWVAVDHSDFNGGFPRAEVDEESPDEITVDVSIRVTPAF
jgi:hypothetical protein